MSINYKIKDLGMSYSHFWDKSQTTYTVIGLFKSWLSSLYVFIISSFLLASSPFILGSSLVPNIYHTCFSFWTWHALFCLEFLPLTYLSSCQLGLCFPREGFLGHTTEVIHFPYYPYPSRYFIFILAFIIFSDFNIYLFTICFLFTWEWKGRDGEKGKIFPIHQFISCPKCLWIFFFFLVCFNPQE